MITEDTSFGVYVILPQMKACGDTLQEMVDSGENVTRDNIHYPIFREGDTNGGYNNTLFYFL